MDFRILGPLEVSDDEAAIDIGGPRQRTVLAMLLLETNRVISIDRLIQAVWDEDPPNTARGQVQICISALRRQLRFDGQERILLRRPGYVLELSDDALDLHVFEKHVGAARSAVVENDLDEARSQFRAALALWRGQALADIPSQLVQQSVAQLDERRLVVLEECMECELRLGVHHDLPGELVGWIKRYPLRERLRMLFMSALHHAGRQAEALDAYLDARTTLMEELGIEPGKELQDLQQAILRGDPPPGMPELGLRPDGVTSGARKLPQTPRSLPAAIPDFTGRGKIVDYLTKQITQAITPESSPHAVCVDIIIGQGGVGKTTLAVHVAHMLAPRFPDGQLFARLRNGDDHTNPSDILERFLRLLGVPSSAIPADIEARAEMYRSLLAERRILIVLDDAMSEQQVAALLPGTPQCAVIITSRRRLTGIAASSRIELRGFSDQSAVKLLTQVVGPARIGAEPEAVVTLCRFCANLPIAVRIVAARLAARPHWKASDLAARLLDDSRRLDELNHDGIGVRASLWLTYRSLSPGARRLFRMLAVLDAPGFAYWVGSPLLEMDVLTAQDLMEELTEAYLISADPDPAGLTRYRFHDIVRSFARERLVAEETAQERHKALQRLAGALLYLTYAAHKREYGGPFVLPTSDASQWPLPDALVSQLMRNPLAWYEAERLTLVSAVAQSAASNMVEHSWDLALHTVTLFESHAYYVDWRKTHELALKVACRTGDRRGEAAMRYSLGSLYMFQRENGKAALQLTQARTLYEQLCDKRGTALTLRNIAYLDRVNGNLELALDRWKDALRVLEELDDQIAVAHTLQNMAQVHLDFGDDNAAHELLKRAELICATLGNRRVGAQVLHRLGELHLRCGHFELAEDAYRRVLAAVREAGDQTGECHALLGLAMALLQRCDLGATEQALAGAGELAAVVGERIVEGRVALARSELNLRINQLEEAGERCDQAIGCFRELKAAILEAQALSLRGRIHFAAGRPDAALAAWRAGHALLSALDPRTALRLSQDLERQISALDEARSSPQASSHTHRRKILKSLINLRPTLHPVNIIRWTRVRQEDRSMTFSGTGRIFAIPLLIVLLFFAADGTGIWHAAIARAPHGISASASSGADSGPDNTIWG